MLIEGVIMSDLASKVVDLSMFMLLGGLCT